MDVEVSVTGGRVRGEREPGVAVFHGIPFASLPERLGAPGAVVPWDDVRPATVFGPPPPQPEAMGVPAADRRPDGWLTVNVWTPDGADGLPVMAWVHGGGYVFGTSGLPEYDGTALARRGVVLVTFNYRVGLEGFAHVDGLPVNRGLLDQVAALEWVQENIATFGGDPARVTVFGQSAGGGSVAALLAMPRAAGLFRRAVAQSVQGTYLTPMLAGEVTAACARELATDPRGLAHLDPWALPAAVDAVSASMPSHVARWGAAAHARIVVAPVVDGDVLPSTPWEGVRGDVELLVGHTRHEARLLSLLDGELGTVTAAHADATATALAPDPARYRATFPDPEERFEVVRSDWLFRMPSVALADAHAAAGGSAHVYELTWPAPGMDGLLGACHGLDVPLVFGTLTRGQPAVLIGEVTDEARQVSEHMQSAWVAFATTGDPGWPPWDGSRTRLFDTAPAVTAYPERASREIWTQPPAVLDVVDGGAARPASRR